MVILPVRPPADPRTPRIVGSSRIAAPRAQRARRFGLAALDRLGRIGTGRGIVGRTRARSVRPATRQPAADRRRRPRRGDARHRGRPPPCDAEPRRPGAAGRPLRAGLLQLALVHAQPAVADHGQAAARRRSDPALDPALRRRAHDGRVVPRPGLPHRRDRQDALQRAVVARLRGAARHGRLGGSPPRAPAQGRRPPPALAAVPGPRRDLAQLRLPVRGPARRVDAVDLLRRPRARVPRPVRPRRSPVRPGRQPVRPAQPVPLPRRLAAAIPSRGVPGPAGLRPRPPRAARDLRPSDARPGPRHPGGLLHVALVR